MSKGRCTVITPIVFVKELDRATDFYVNAMGFEIGVRQDGYAYIVRDGVAIRLIAAETNGESAPQSCYICVENLDDLYAEMKPGLDRLPPGRVRQPFDQPYGQREFHVTDEDGLLIFFGETIQASTE